MNTRKQRWSEDDIAELKGQEESIRLEFKAGSLFDKPQQAWVGDLSKEVSAFANTEGGVLILGLTEAKVGKVRVASNPDGIPDSIATDQLQRLIEGNVSPYLTSLRVHRVRISSLSDRVVFVVDVPQGSTAYQANDCRYYGRSELEAKPLPDHEVRLRMARGKVARASVAFRLCSVTLSADQEAGLRQKHSVALEALKTDAVGAFRSYPELLEIMAARFEPDVVEFELTLQNDGELTIREPAVQLFEHRSESLIEGWTIQGQPLSSRIGMPSEVIYPNDERSIDSSRRQFRCKRDAPLSRGDYIVRWRVFLDNSPPSHGELDLGQHIEAARTPKSSDSA